MRTLYAVLCVGLGIAWALWDNPLPVRQPPGILVPEEPVQVALKRPEAAIEWGRYKLQPRADFTIRARVLSRSRYRFDQLSDLVPIDLALGWGRMSDTDILRQMKIRQQRRFFYWSTNAYPLAPNEIITHASNMHMIPADDDVEKQLFAVRRGNIVRLSGKLVDIYGPDQLTMRTSLTRNDTGAGACEIIWVESAQIEP